MPLQLHNCNILSITTKPCKGLVPKREKTERDAKAERREQRLTDTHFYLNKETTLSGLKLWLFQPTNTKENYRAATSESINISISTPATKQKIWRHKIWDSIYDLQPKLPELISASDVSSSGSDFMWLRKSNFFLRSFQGHVSQLYWIICLSEQLQKQMLWSITLQTIPNILSRKMA